MMTGSSDLAMERTLADDVLTDGGGEVGTGVGRDDRERLVILHHCGEVVEGYVGTRIGAIEAPVSVDFDDDRLRGWGHYLRSRSRVVAVERRRPPGGIAFKIGGFCSRGYHYCDTRCGRGLHPGPLWI